MLKLASCGNDCNFCPRYTATQSDDVERLKEVAALWNRVGWRDVVVSPEEMVCYGCSSANWCRYDIRKCVLEKKVDNCGECKGYPCENVLKTFEQTELYAKDCREKLSKEDYERFHKAFFSKSENLDRANKEYLSQIKSK